MVYYTYLIRHFYENVPRHLHVHQWSPRSTAGKVYLKDRHQWWGRGFRCSLSLNMDKLFPKAIMYVL